MTVWTCAIGGEPYVTGFTGDDRRHWDTAAAPYGAAPSPGLATGDAPGMDERAWAKAH
jgi:hypothetical protein